MPDGGGPDALLPVGGAIARLLDRGRYELEVEDTFDAGELDASLWVPHYLPQWSSRELGAARYDIGNGSLRLRIDADQPPWSPEWNGGLRVSSLQTGVFAGPVGSEVGQHHFRPGLIVREAQRPAALYTPRYGLVEVRARALTDPSCLVAMWMIGFEDRPERSAEICVMEIFGRDVGPTSARVGMGLHPFGDPAIRDEFAAAPVAIDAQEPHTYSAEWPPDRVVFHVDDVPVKVVNQSPAYPMQVMLNIYELAGDPGPLSPADRYPRVFTVERFAGYRPVAGPGARPPARRHPSTLS